jgi:hypothetical protein
MRSIDSYWQYCVFWEWRNFSACITAPPIELSAQKRSTWRIVKELTVATAHGKSSGSNRVLICSSTPLQLLSREAHYTGKDASRFARLHGIFVLGKLTGGLSFKKLTLCIWIWKVHRRLHRNLSLQLELSDLYFFNLLKPTGNFTYHQV